MSSLHKAIYTVHTNAVRVDKDRGVQDEIVAYDTDGNEISINWTAVNSKNTELINEDAAAKTATANNKASGKTKLKNLGLSDDEIKALVGI